MHCVTILSQLYTEENTFQFDSNIRLSKHTLLPLDFEAHLHVFQCLLMTFFEVSCFVVEYLLIMTFLLHFMATFNLLWQDAVNISIAKFSNVFLQKRAMQNRSTTVMSHSCNF